MSDSEFIDLENEVSGMLRIDFCAHVHTHMYVHTQKERATEEKEEFNVCQEITFKYRNMVLLYN